MNICSINNENDFIKHFSNEKKSVKMITFANAYSYYKLIDDKLCSHFDYIFFDGILLVKLYNLKFKKNIKRVSFDFTSIADRFFRQCVSENFSVSIIGAKEQEIVKTYAYLQKRYGHCILNYRSGYFNSVAEEEDYFNYINNNNVSVVLVGMGAPTQELFSIKLKNKCKNLKFIITCGGFLSQTVNGEYYPHFFNKFNLRWLYRLYKHKHVRNKFFKEYPKFILRFINE